MRKVFIILLTMVCGVMDCLAQTAISCNEDLLGMSSSGNYYLTSDLELEGWIPMATFTGTLDGRGHSIILSEGQLDAEGRAALFSTTDGAEIRNLVVGGKFVEIQNTSGGLVAVATNTTLLNCETETILASSRKNVLLGGLVGIMDGGSMINCSSRGTLEGYLLGGLAASTRNGAAIKNCYSQSTFISRTKDNESQVGGLVHDHGGLLENCYVALGRDGMFVPSIGQLNQMYMIRGFCLLVPGGTLPWADGPKPSSTVIYDNTAVTMDHFGQITRHEFVDFFNSQGSPIRYAHEFFGAGYNYGDYIYISGLPCIVFEIHENGMGGVAATTREDNAQDILAKTGNHALRDYYQECGGRREEYEYAICHDGITAYGDITPVIPAEFNQNAGRFYTFMLRDEESGTENEIFYFNLFKEGYIKKEAIQQLAYTSTGQMTRCYYPFKVDKVGLINGATPENSCEFDNPGTPYVFGDFGPPIYRGTQLTDMTLVDTLNAWVALQDNDIYARWDVPNTMHHNYNMPIHRYHFHNGSGYVNCAIERGWRYQHKALRYADINALNSEQTAIGNYVVYYDNLDDINTDNVSTPWDGTLYITENASLKGNYLLNAHVCITLDNSDASGFAAENYDWHCFSSSLSNAPVGISYLSYTNGGPSGTPSVVSFKEENGYFPKSSPYTGWDFYCYHEPTCGWLNFKRKTGDHYNPWNGMAINYTNETDLIQGKGYLAAVKRKTGLLAYGRMNNGDIPITLSKQGEHWEGYNLLGNPYHAYLDFDAFCDDNEEVMTQRAYAILDADHQGYICYCPEASDNPVYAPRYLHPHQGFFIQANTDNAQAVFKTSQTVATPTSAFREEPLRYPLINLSVKDDEGRKDYATVELDRPWEGGMAKLQGLRSGKAEVSISHQSTEYSIAFLTDRPESIPVHLKVSGEGDYLLQWGILHAEIPYLHLIDNLTGADIDLLTPSGVTPPSLEEPAGVTPPSLEEPAGVTPPSGGAGGAYTFHARKEDSPSRFKLVFSHTELEEKTEDESSNTSPFAHLSDHGLTVHRQGLLELCDLHGRILWTKAVDTPGIVPLPHLGKGVYLLRLRGPQGTRGQKIIL